MIRWLFIFVFSVFFCLGCAKSDSKQPIQEPARKPTEDPADQGNYCAPAELKEFGIIGGRTVAGGARLARGMVILFQRVIEQGEEKQRICSGILVDSNIVLTAAHCVHGAAPSDLRVAFSAQPICDFKNNEQMDLYSASRVIAHKSFDPVLMINDVALVQLSIAAPVGSLPLVVSISEKLKTSDEVILAGFGKTKGYSADEPAEVHRLRIARVKSGIAADIIEKVSQVSKFSVSELSNQPGNSRLFFDQRDGESACAGDSGGPALLRRDGLLSVIGVASFVFDSTQIESCKFAIAYTNLSFFNDWLRTSYLQLANESSERKKSLFLD